MCKMEISSNLLDGAVNLVVQRYADGQAINFSASISR